MAIAFARGFRKASSLLRSSYPLLDSSRLLPQSQEFYNSTSIFVSPRTISRPVCRNFSHGTVNLVISEGKPKFETRELDPPKKYKWLTKKPLKLKRKKEREERNAANRKDPRRLTVKGKKKKFANVAERLTHKLEKAKIKEALLIEKLKRYEVAKVQGPEVRPHEITGEERFYLKKMGQKRSNSVPIGRRGVFGGVILNMHLHWKKHGTVKVICNNSKPGLVKQYAEELAKLSGGVPVNIIGDDTIILYRGKDYAKIKEAFLIEKLKRYDVAKVQGPHEIMGEERFYLKKMGQKRSNYVPIGRRGVFGGVILNMHLHWKKHETVKVICNNSKPGLVQQYAKELAKLSGGVPVNIIGDDTIIFYRGKDYVQPQVMSPIDTLSKKRAYERSKYEQSLESVKHFIAITEKELELYCRHVALYDDPNNRSPLSILDDSPSESHYHHENELYLSCSDTDSNSEDEDEDEDEDEELCELDNGSSSSAKEELSERLKLKTDNELDF